MKFCKDCRHFERLSRYSPRRPWPRCLRVEAISDPVFGDHQSADFFRHYGSACGPDARLFEPALKKPFPVRDRLGAAITILLISVVVIAISFIFMGGQ
jgi:hypothetical protein